MYKIRCILIWRIFKLSVEFYTDKLMVIRSSKNLCVFNLFCILPHEIGWNQTDSDVRNTR